MYVYSKPIIQFIAEIKHTIKTILSNEARLTCTEGRFYNRQKTCSYPFGVVIYNHKSMLGYFDPEFYELGFHECLMRANKEQLHNIIRHELAHYLTFIKHGAQVKSHAGEFQTTCKELGWGEQVSKATIALEANPSLEESDVLRKVKKLMALTTSSHPNEAEQAMLKSRQLLLKHNLEPQNLQPEIDDKIFVQRILQQKKETAKMRAIGAILKTFFISIIYHRGTQFTYLEIMGNAVNIEIAEYVAQFLQAEMDNLWNGIKRTTALKGAIAKNSFFLGIAKGYCNKIEALKKEHPQEMTKALIILEKQLIDAQAMVYPRLSSRKTSAHYCASSASLGEKAGRQLNINPAIHQSAHDSTALLN